MQDLRARDIEFRNVEIERQVELIRLGHMVE